MIGIHWGASRVVVVCGPIAVKFPRGEVGMRCNRYEARIWRENKDHPTRGPRLCPVLWCHDAGHVLVMPATTPLPAHIDPLSFPLNWWDHMPPGDGCPCEPKREDWGMLDGRPVAHDYSAPAL